MKIREPAVAGMFYSASEKKLREQVNQLLSEAVISDKIKNVFGIVSPHAGYVYSGKTAAYGYNQLDKNKIDTVVVISPSHREYFKGISIYDGDAYRTPLGDVFVNQTMADKLVESSKDIFRGLQGHRAEHSLEVQIPFLQIVLENFSIVPIILGDQSRYFVSELAEKLASVVDDKTLIVASSDLSHFHSKSKAEKLDSVIQKGIEDFDFVKLQNDLENGMCEACGGGPIVSLLKLAKLLGKHRSKVLAYSTSGDVTGDNSEVVGYLSAVVY
jgi:hypothetical protein